MNELLALSFSPWSEKARWALDARGVPYVERAYQPMIGELELRVKLRKLTGPVSVPVLFTWRTAIADSTGIARHAELTGSGASLFPEGRDAEIARYDALAQKGLEAGRGLTLSRMSRDEEALREQVPTSLRKVLGPLAPPIARWGVERVRRKYGADRASLAQHEATLLDVLETLRAELAKAPSGKPRTLLGAFSYADIAMAQVMFGVSPPSSPALRMGKASRRSFENPSLVTEYADLLAWRDALYTHYRRR
jgi:glutathione S-transferase